MDGIDIGTAIALMKSISGAVDVSAAETAASDAEAYAAGTRDGVTVGSSDPAYQNNAAYYAAQARSNSYAVSVSGTGIVFAPTSE